MPFDFKDRVSTKPGRVKITPENGSAYYAVMERADNPTAAGTPLTAANLNAAQETLAYNTADGLHTYKRVYVSTTGNDNNSGETAATAMATVKAAIRKYAKWHKYMDIYLADGTYTEDIGTISTDQCSLSIRSSSENKDAVTINMATMLESHISLLRLYNLTLNVTANSIRAVSINAGMLYAFGIRVNVPAGSSANCVNVYNGASVWMMDCIVNAGTAAAVYGNQALHIKCVNCTSERTLVRGFYANNGATIEYTPTLTATTMVREENGGKCVLADTNAGEMGSMYGQHIGADGVLIQWGTVTITPAAAGEPTYTTVTFPMPYAEVPGVVATPISTVPESLSVAVVRSGEYVPNNKRNVGIALTRAGLTPTGINWLAIGKGAF